MPEVITIWVPEANAILAAWILVTMPPRDSSLPALPAIASISGVICRTSASSRLSMPQPGGAV